MQEKNKKYEYSTVFETVIETFLIQSLYLTHQEKSLLQTKWQTKPQAISPKNWLERTSKPSSLHGNPRNPALASANSTKAEGCKRKGLDKSARIPAGD